MIDAARGKVGGRNEWRDDAPADWLERNRELATSSGLAVAIAARNEVTVAAFNDNSICRALQASPKHAPLCQPFCGRALERAREAGGLAHYRCHVGLRCVAAPIVIGGREVAVVGGRAFLFSADYRAFIERVRNGDLSEIDLNELFRNVLFTTQQRLEQLAARLAEIAARSQPSLDESGAAHAAEDRWEERLEDALGIASGQTLREVCHRLGRKLSAMLKIDALAVLARSGRTLVPLYVSGLLISEDWRLDIQALGGAAQSSTLLLEADGHGRRGRSESLEIFPLHAAEGISGAIAVKVGALLAEKRQAFHSLCTQIGAVLEVARLREELGRRKHATATLRSFLERASELEVDQMYIAILHQVAELLRAERSSLLLFDEGANELIVRAAVGPHAEVVRMERVRLGEMTSGKVLREGRPLLVRDLTERPSGAEERSYRTRSFISYPLIIGSKRIGVLNVTDRSDGEAYDEFDLELIEILAPQIALALSTAEWQEKAHRFQQLSVTDPLTGLYNRRYLEARIIEELERSKRQGYAMSFMMIDVDDFKHYNDLHGHQAGDVVLQRIAKCLRADLRASDSAARYGGEEFSVLLPETSLAEAEIIAERVRQRVQLDQHPFAEAQPLGAITVSIGLAAFGPALDTAEAIIGAADKALYMAKKRGKNQIALYSESDDVLRGAE
jgi:diguanylate cyclase (GGDEF)-like protein